MPAGERDEQSETSADCLLRFFTATERLLQAADDVREASAAMLASAERKPVESGVRHDG